MYTDLPLNKLEDDKLGRYLFAKEIANGLVKSFRNSNESIVLGVNGPWGSGKSTLLNFIINEVTKLSKKENIIILNFNPWMFSGQKELQNIFLKELYLKFNSNKEKLKVASEKLANFLGHLNWLKYINSGAGEAVKDAKSFLEGLSKEKDLSQLKNEVDQLLIESGVKLYITIDDIDRLTPSEITDIFQLVKLNGNFANTIFLLAYDREVVTGALNKQFGENGDRYLEKIIQVDYTLPNISRIDIERIFIDSLKHNFKETSIKKSIEESFDKLKNEDFIKLFKSLRDVYRFNNSLKLRLPSIHQELNVRDFFLIESLRIFKPKVYELIIECKNILTSNNSNKYTYSSQPDNDKKESFIAELEIDNISKSIIRSLFTINKLDIFESTSTPEDLIREKKIINPNYFDRYFNLQLSPTDTQEETFNKFIKSKTTIGEKIRILKNINQNNGLFQFLNWIEIKSIKSDKQEIESMLDAAFDYSNSVEYKKENLFSRDSDYMTILRFCSRNISRLKTYKERRLVVKKHINKQKDNLSFSTYYTISSIIRSKKLFDEGKLKFDQMWYYLFSKEKNNNNIYDKQLKQQFKKVIKELYIKFTGNKNLLNTDELVMLLFDLKEYHSRYYDTEFKKLLKDNSILIELLINCITSSFVSSSSGTAYQLSKKQLLHGMDVNNIKVQLEKLEMSKLNPDQKAAINFFMNAYKNGFQERVYYDFYTLECLDRS